MKRVFFIRDSIENRVSYWLLLLFMAFLAIDRFYSTLMLLGLCAHTAIYFRKSMLKLWTRDIIILQSVFWVTLISTVYALYPQNALDVSSKQMAILLFPLLLSSTTLNLKKYRYNLLLAFSLACTAVVLFLFYDAFHIIVYNRLHLSSIFSSAFVNHNFSLSIGLHATYLSMLLAMAVSWLLQQLTTVSKGRERRFFIICLAILGAGLLQLGSKSVFAAVLIIVNIAIPLVLLNGRKRLVFCCCSLALFVGLITVMLSVDAFRERYLTLLRKDLEESNTISNHSGRLDRWERAFDLISAHPLLGTGSGSEIPRLREDYFTHKMYSAYLESLNVHNQFLGLLINNGILGLLIFLGTLVWGFVTAWRRRDLMLFCFLILVSVVCMAEDLLDVNKGIFFYACFFSFLVLSGAARKQHYSFRKERNQPISDQYSIEGKL